MAATRSELELGRGRSSVTALHVHLVFVTKYRRPVFTDPLLTDCQQLVTDICTDDRSETLPVVALLLVRGEELILTPDDALSLQIGDQLLLAGKSDGLSDLSDALFNTATITYVTTGQVLPSTWVWRMLTQRRRAR